MQCEGRGASLLSKLIAFSYKNSRPFDELVTVVYSLPYRHVIDARRHNRIECEEYDIILYYKIRSCFIMHASSRANAR